MVFRIQNLEGEGGLFGYHESGLYHDLGEDSPGPRLLIFMRIG